MGSPAIIDIDAMLAPVEGDNPCGPDPRGAADGSTGPTDEFSNLKQANKAARDAEKADYAGSLGAWDDVKTQAMTILATQSKDLQVAAWLADAMARVDGAAGLRDGVKLLAGLCSQYWDTVHPLVDVHGLDYRVTILTSLNSTLVAALNRLPLTEGRRDRPYNRIDHVYTVELAKAANDPDRTASLLEQGAITEDQFRAACIDSSPAFFSALRDDLTEAKAALNSLASAMRDKLATDAPPTSAIADALDDCLSIIERLGQFSSGESAGEDESGRAAGGESAPASSGKSSGGKAVGRVSVGDVPLDRESILNAIATLTRALDRIEPQSLIVPKLDFCVKLGRLDRVDLLTTLIEDETARQALFKWIGLQSKEPPGEE